MNQFASFKDFNTFRQCALQSNVVFVTMLGFNALHEVVSFFSVP